MADNDKPTGAATAKPKSGAQLSAVALFEVVAVHDPDDKGAGAPREGEAHLRAIAPPDGAAAAIVLPAGTGIVARGRRLRLGQRFALRLPLARVGPAGEPDDADDDD